MINQEKDRGHHLRKHKLPIAANLLWCNVTAGALNQLWVGDGPYVATEMCRLYLAVFLYLLSRQVVRWIMLPHVQANW